MANFKRDSNSPELAITHYQEAIRLWPWYASAHNNLGTLMTSAVEAERHFLSAITISPSHVNALYNLGQVYRKTNRTLEAVAVLEKCLRLDSSYSPAYLVLAKLHSPPIAARLLHHVTRLLPNSPDYQSYFGDWLYERGVTKLALKFYLRALNLQSSHLASVLGVARCLRAQGQLARLHRLLIRWYLPQRGPGAVGHLIYVPELYLRGGSWDVYKPSQTTAPDNTYQAAQTDHGKNKDSGPRWWRSLGAVNLTKNSCRNQQSTSNSQERIFMKGDSHSLDPCRLCVCETEQPSLPGS